MASYYQTKKTIPLMGGHICSKCGSVILTDFIFYSLANSRWTQKKAQEGAEAAAQQGLKALLSFNEKPFMVTEVSEERTYSLVSGFGLEQLDHGCPYCGNRERWQLNTSVVAGCRLDPESGVTLVTDVPEESRLAVLSSKEALDLWRIKIMSANMLKIKQHWAENSAEAARIRDQIQTLNRHIESLNAKKATVREMSQLLLEKVESKKAEVKGFSLFSAERKAAKAELKELEKQHSAQRDADLAQERSIISTISALEKQIKDLKISNPGVLGEMETVTPADAPYCQAIRFS